MDVRDLLAAEGGKPVRVAPFPPWPAFDDQDIEEVAKVLASGKVNYWTGNEGRRFESEFAESCGRRHGVAVANGTVALELALHALGIGAGDEVIVSCRSFVASASSIVMCGATPILADVDSVSQNISAETVRGLITERTRAIIAVHLNGWPCEMQSLLELSQKHGIKVIEDCAQAQGAGYRGLPVGSLGDVAAFSFCQDKIMTTGGEGGMLVTDDEDVYLRAWSFKEHGKSYEAAMRLPVPPATPWMHDRRGTNWRLTELQAALGRAGLRKLPGWLERRRGYARLLDERLTAVPGLRVTVPPHHVAHAYYKYHAFVLPELLRAGWSRDRIVAAVAAEGVPCSSGLRGELYLENAFIQVRPPSRLPAARALAETALVFLVHPTLERQDVEDACRAIDKVMRRAAKSVRDAGGESAPEVPASQPASHTHRATAPCRSSPGVRG